MINQLVFERFQPNNLLILSWSYHKLVKHYTSSAIYNDSKFFFPLLLLYSYSLWVIINNNKQQTINIFWKLPRNQQDSRTNKYLPIETGTNFWNLKPSPEK